MSPDTEQLRGGLSRRGVQERLAADGPNTLPPPDRPSSLRRLAAQLVNPFALLLWGAVVLSALAQLTTMALAIVAVVLANALFAFAQGRRADRAAELLDRLLPVEVAVRRAGTVERIGADGVVVGDVLVLEAGDRVPADARVLASSALLVDASTLTGEGEAGPAGEGDPLYAGTFVVEGTADALVTATGIRTRLAGIARSTTLVAAHVTPLTAELTRVVRGIGLLALLVGLAFWGLSVVLGRPLVEGYQLALGVTVALVPEALLPTVTLALAWGAEQMAHHNVLVRSLDAVETLGSTTFVCTDKTGTLTCNEMTVVEAWVPGGRARVVGPGYRPVAQVVVEGEGARAHLERLASSGARCSRGFVHEVEGVWRPLGDPMEAAIDAFARRLGLDTDTPRTAAHRDTTFAFDPHRRRMSVLADGLVLAKGAPDAILELCEDPGGLLAEARAAAEEWSNRGLRVLAVAGRPVGAQVPLDGPSAERGLGLYGLVALHDPPRLDVADALAACRRAGVKVAMITGDHPVTAKAIATQVGLRSPGDPVLLGAELPTGLDELGEVMDHDGVVIARVDPEDKLRIAHALRRRGHVVAMTGDGVNDGPALREADIGIAMGASGTDVAREAADLVLLDDHFASIVAGIELGRATYLNVRRFLTYHLTDNVAELAPFVVWGLTGGNIPLALGVLQILALDLGTDTFSAVALGAEPPGATVLGRQPVAGRLLDRRVLGRAFVLLGPAEAVMSLLAFWAALAAAGWSPGGDAPGASALAAASGAAFAAVVLGQAANAFACRSASVPPWTLGWWSNRLLGPAVLVGLGLSATTLLVGPIAAALGQHVPGLAGGAVALLTPLVVLTLDAGDKALRRRRAPGREADRSGLSRAGAPSTPAR